MERVNVGLGVAGPSGSRLHNHLQQQGMKKNASSPCLRGWGRIAHGLVKKRTMKPTEFIGSLFWGMTETGAARDIFAAPHLRFYCKKNAAKMAASDDRW